jgi:WhiB family redox-sensing transcriptional regulator
MDTDHPMNPLQKAHHNNISRKLKNKDINTTTPQTPPTHIPTNTWRDQANCKGRQPDMFPKGHKDISYLATARAICRECPVKTECLEYALEFPPADMHGVWAGLTSRQLLDEQRRRGVRAVRPTIAGLWGFG